MKKTIFVVLISIVATLIIGYGLYVLYDIIMTDVALRLKEAIAEGIREGLSSAVNPIHWAQTLLRES